MITATQFIDKKKIDKILVTQVAGHFAVFAHLPACHHHQLSCDKTSS